MQSLTKVGLSSFGKWKTNVTSFAPSSMDKLFVIKIGGNVLDAESALKPFLTDFAAVQSPKILIHGGGSIATKIGDKLGIESRQVKGRRITDAATLDLVTMVYGGLINKQLVARLQQLGCNAMGFTGADGNLIKGIKRPIVVDNNITTDFGFVGDITQEGVNSSLLLALLNQSIVPVFAPLCNGDGTLLNTNADTIASVLSIALSKHFNVRLIYCFEKKGVLTNVQDENSVIPLLDSSLYKELSASGSFHDGILPKLENAFSAIQSGVKEVLIGDAANLSRNTSKETIGTLIRH